VGQEERLGLKVLPVLVALAWVVTKAIRERKDIPAIQG
jgi:hypothetical protein